MVLNSHKLIDPVLNEIIDVLHKVKEQQIDAVAQLIEQNKRVFVLGSGRSGLMAKSFAMRLMHIGYTVYVVGETITPAIRKGDVLFAVSGSGTTSNIVTLTQRASEQGVTIISVTSDSNSTLAKLGNRVIIVPGATKAGTGIKSIQLLSTLFDQSVHVVLDILCLKLSIHDHVTSQNAGLTHSNME